MEQLPKWWTPCVVLLVIVVVQAILFVAIIEVGRGLHPEGVIQESQSGSLALYSVVKNTVVSLVLLVRVRLGRAGTSAILGLKRVSALGITVACFTILSLVPWDMYLAGQLGAERMRVGANTSYFNAALMMSSMSLVLLTPVAEELFFRGFALSVFGKRSVIAGVLGSCVLCGTYHFSGSVASLIVPLPFALATAYSVVVTGSVYPAIVAHALWNLLAVGADAGYVFLEPTRGTLFASAVVGATCAGLLLRMNRRRRGGTV